MKKRVLSIIIACFVLLGCTFSLAGCVLAAGPLTVVSGTYEFEFLGSTTSYEFSPFGKVTYKVDTGLGIGNVTKEGTYKISGDEIEFEFDGETSTHSFSYGEEEGVGYVKIDILTYDEVK